MMKGQTNMVTIFYDEQTDFGTFPMVKNFKSVSEARTFIEVNKIENECTVIHRGEEVNIYEYNQSIDTSVSHNRITQWH